MTSPGAFHALMMRRHMEEYGTTTDQLGAIAVTFRRHASLNPDAVMRTPFTLEEYRAARYICEPLRLLDYCLINDGGVAMILTTRRARARPEEAPGVRPRLRAGVRARRLDVSTRRLLARADAAGRPRTSTAWRASGRATWTRS